MIKLEVIVPQIQKEKFCGQGKNYTQLQKQKTVKPPRKFC